LVIDRYLTRRDKLRRAVKKIGAQSLLVTNFSNVTYLTGFTGDDSYLLVGADKDVVLSDFRYETQLGGECEGIGFEIRQAGVSMSDFIVAVVGSMKIGQLAIEADSMTVAKHDFLREKLSRVEFVPTSGLVEQLRWIKDKSEIDRIRRAVSQAEKSFGVLRATLLPEKTEKQVADDLEHQMRLFGARERAFQSVVAVSVRAAMPHAIPGEQQIGSGDFVLVDWGADEGLYKSDLTRVLVTGRISPKLERIYGVVLNAQLKAIESIGPGVVACDVDRVARDLISDAGFDKYFGHSLGHGFGLEVHEGPRLAAGSRTVLKPGMVVTVEPGIYLPGWGGIRIEDDVLVTRDGHEVLSSVPKQLEDVIVR